MGVKKNECLAILGSTAAGKTTLFKLFIGEIMPSHGNIRLHKEPTYMNLKKQSQRLSYCPQEDVLFGSLTPR